MNIDKIKIDNGFLCNVDTSSEEGIVLLNSHDLDIQELEATEIARLEAIKTRETAKMNADYNGTNISLTSKDALGLLQVQSAFTLGETETNFLFANGTVMVLKNTEFTALATFFAQERNKLFI